MKRKITDLGENEVIHTPTLEEAIEINKVLNPGWTKSQIEGQFYFYQMREAEACYGEGHWCSLAHYQSIDRTILPASDFLPDIFYQVEPKVGQLWEWIKEDTVFHKKGKPYEILAIVEKLVKPCNIALRCEDEDLPHYMDEKWLRDNFKFHSHPNETMKTEETTLNTQQEKVVVTEKELIDAATISDRKRESFRFYDMLPPELAKQAKENFDEGFTNVVPKDLGQAIINGWNFARSKEEKPINWNIIHNDIINGKHPLSEAHSDVDDFTFSAKAISKESDIRIFNDNALIHLYSKLDDNGKAVMRETYPNVEWPKVKEYVSAKEAISTRTYISGSDSKGEEDFVYVYNSKNCTPEIVGNEIRFVKN